jgi:hypothetical protein
MVVCLCQECMLVKCVSARSATICVGLMQNWRDMMSPYLLDRSCKCGCRNAAITNRQPEASRLRFRGQARPTARLEWLKFLRLDTFFFFIAQADWRRQRVEMCLMIMSVLLWFATGHTNNRMVVNQLPTLLSSCWRLKDSGLRSCANVPVYNAAKLIGRRTFTAPAIHGLGLHRRGHPAFILGRLMTIHKLDAHG